MDPELEKYRELFSQDANDQLEAIRQLLPKWEVDPGNAELAKKLHRAFHSLKGLSATMGFSDIFALAQRMAALYDKIKRGLENNMNINMILKAQDFGTEDKTGPGLTDPIPRLADLSRRSLPELQELVAKHVGKDK